MHIHLKPLAIREIAAPRSPRPSGPASQPADVRRVAEWTDRDRRGGSQQRPERPSSAPEPGQDDPSAPHDPAASLALILAQLDLAGSAAEPSCLDTPESHG